MNETWLILGGSSGLGRALARQAAMRPSTKILLAGRDLADLEASAADLRLRHQAEADILHFDVAAPDTHADMVREAARRAQGLLSVCLVSGEMAAQDEVEREPSRVVRMATVNFTGAMSVLLHVANLLEDRRAGRIVVIGSVAGDRGRRRNYAYGATKAGLHVFTSGLDARLWRSDVSVTLVKPGPLDTAMVWGLPEAKLAADPDRVASAILRAAVAGKRVLYVPFAWRLIMNAIGLVPSVLFRRMKF